MSALPDAVIVFGASGFIGRNIVDALAGKVTTLIGVTQRTAAVPGCTAMTTIDRIDGLPTLPRETVVINVAAVRYDAGTFRADQSAIMRANVEIAGAVFGFCAARGISDARMYCATKRATMQSPYTRNSKTSALSRSHWKCFRRFASARSRRSTARIPRNG